MWRPVCDSCRNSRVYWYHTTTNHVRWDDPKASMIHTAQSHLTDVLAIGRSQALARVCRTTIGWRLQLCLRRWRAYCDGHFQNMINVFDSWHRMRQRVVRILQQRNEREVEFEDAMRAAHTQYESLLQEHERLIASHAQAQVRCADMQYALLEKRLQRG